MVSKLNRTHTVPTQWIPPGAGANLLPPAEPPMTIYKDTPPNSQVFTALNDEKFLAPAGTDFQIEYNAGATDGLWGIGQIITWGRFDYQRNAGKGYLESGNTLYLQYENGGNYGVGVYMRGANYSLQDTYKYGDDFAGLTSHRSEATKTRQHHWWELGWDAANAGKPNGK